jgi:hypothetical protein
MNDPQYDCDDIKAWLNHPDNDDELADRVQCRECGTIVDRDKTYTIGGEECCGECTQWTKERREHNRMLEALLEAAVWMDRGDFRNGNEANGVDEGEYRAGLFRVRLGALLREIGR